MRNVVFVWLWLLLSGGALGAYAHQVSGAPASLILLAVVVGLCVGSFLNVVIWRLPQMLERQYDLLAREHLGLGGEDVTDETFNLSFPRSHCPFCKHSLSARELVPLFSWLFQGARCRSCGVPISARYPLVESVVGLLTGLCLIRFGVTPVCATVVLFVWISSALALIDADTYLLPDELTQPLLWLSLFANTMGYGFVSGHEAILGAIMGYGACWAIARGGAWVFKKEALGEGDWKYIAAVGALLGGMAVPYLFLLASLSALVGTLVQRVFFRRELSDGLKTAIPFGPHLVIAALVMVLWRAPLNQLLHSLGQVGF